MKHKIRLTTVSCLAITLAALSGCATPPAAPHAKMRECIVKDGKVYDTAGNVMVGCVARYDGNMMSTTDARLAPMKENMRMSNGLVCLVDGTCIMKDGSRRKLQEGEVFTPEGEFMRIKPPTR